MIWAGAMAAALRGSASINPTPAPAVHAGPPMTGLSAWISLRGSGPSSASSSVGSFSSSSSCIAQGGNKHVVYDATVTRRLLRRRLCL